MGKDWGLLSHRRELRVPLCLPTPLVEADWTPACPLEWRPPLGLDLASTNGSKWGWDSWRCLRATQQLSPKPSKFPFPNPCVPLSHYVGSDSATPWTITHQAPLPMDFPGKSPEIGCHFFLQGIFLMQGLNPHLLHWQQVLYHQATREASLTYTPWTLTTLTSGSPPAVSWLPSTQAQPLAHLQFKVSGKGAAPHLGPSHPRDAGKGVEWCQPADVTNRGGAVGRIPWAAVHLLPVGCLLVYLLRKPHANGSQVKTKSL